MIFLILLICWVAGLFFTARYIEKVPWAFAFFAWPFAIYLLLRFGRDTSKWGRS